MGNTKVIIAAFFFVLTLSQGDRKFTLVIPFQMVIASFPPLLHRMLNRFPPHFFFLRADDDPPPDGCLLVSDNRSHRPPKAPFVRHGVSL